MTCMIYRWTLRLASGPSLCTGVSVTIIQELSFIGNPQGCQSPRQHYGVKVKPPEGCTRVPECSLFVEQA